MNLVHVDVALGGGNMAVTCEYSKEPNSRAPVGKSGDVGPTPAPE